MQAMRIFFLCLFFFGGHVASAQALSAPEVLQKLPVQAERESGYERDLFRHWIDKNQDGCDTRQEVLRRQNKKRAPCSEREGEWFSAFDGLFFQNSSHLDVDHFVPLAEAWRSGARRWAASTRTRFANDLYGYSLLAVSASSNRSKGDRDPSEWLPSRTSFHCSYLSRWVAIKYRWRLRVDRRERGAIRRGFSVCHRGQLRVDKLKRARIDLKQSGN